MATSRFQFSIRLLLLATAIIAAVVAAVRVESNAVATAALSLMAAFFCSLATLAAMRATGKRRAFWVGAAMPGAAGLAFVTFTYHSYRAGMLFDSSIPLDTGPHLQIFAAELRAGLPLIWCSSAVNGLSCVVAHWVIWPASPEQDL